MVDAWVSAELESVDLKDPRLNQRLHAVLSQLAEHPTASIPAACGGYAEMTAAYRLFDNDKVTFEGILAPHVAATRQRLAAQAVVILAQDTTELDLTRPQQQVAGVGPLDGNTRRGALLHPLHAFTPDGTPLGTLQARIWTRDDKVLSCAAQSRAQRATTPIAQKESYRWVQTLQRGGEEARRCPETQCICVADSEADIYELLVAGATDAPPAQWIVRACYDRALTQPPGQTAGEKHLRAQVLAQRVLFRQTVEVRGRQAKLACDKRGRRQPRQSRSAEIEVRAACVTLRPPYRKEDKLPAIKVNVVLACEINAPPEEVPVEWLLLTSLPIETLEHVRRVIQYYCVRWMIEVFFRVLKSGCRVEARRFAHFDRVTTCLAVYLIVAWRTLYLCRLGRSCPEISCEAVFEPAEWKSVWQVVHQTTPPRKPPQLGQMVRWVAQLGGYVNRTRADPPGPQTVWIGVQRMHDFALCWQRFGPDARASPKHV